MDFYVHVFGLSFILGLLLTLIFKQPRRTKTVCIVVLGDIGRSPRMQYHAKSFLKEGFVVELVGYSGSAPLKELTESSNVKIHYLTSSPNLNNRLSKLISYAVKVIWQSINLFYVLIFKCKSSFLLVQNPPAIPTIPICWVYCCCTKTEFAIDWHNYAYSIMALSMGEQHSLVYFATSIEAYFGAMATYNFCVTKAMQEDLKNKWNIEAKVLYDRPPEEFRPLSMEEKHDFLVEFCDQFLKSNPNYSYNNPAENSTIFTQRKSNGEVVYRTDRPALVVSSTSWTEDEDFSILINAFDGYENECETNDTVKFPDLICVITGKGPLKEFYSAIIERRNWKHVFIVTPWLKNEDYPKLLACADLGVCLHTSSSGLDLPMKVVDMFGCGLPVCAYNFKCLNELVKHNQNSLVFSNVSELTEQLISWLKKSPDSNEQQENYTKFKAEIAKFQQLRWHANWTSEVMPCFEC